MYKDINKKIVATIEARMSASRLPGKMLLPLAGKPTLQRLIERIKQSKYVDEIIVATTVNQADKAIADLAEKLQVKYWRGSEEDVLSRVLDAARHFGGDIIVEITGDCPLIYGSLIDKGIEEFFNHNVDYVSNVIRRSYPDGYDIQVFPVSVLEQVDKLTQNPIDRVHVSYYIYNHPQRFKLHNWESEKENHWPDLRVTLDELKDYELLNKIFENLLPINEFFTVNQVINYLKNNPKLLEINKDVRTKKAEEK
jgi:spore coat polysaccharide biosynthesis protein SpsF